jgi:hypothetical protein
LLYSAFGKPLDSVEMQVERQTTIAGLPDDILARAREYARKCSEGIL